MTRYLIRVKGSTDIAFKVTAESLAELQYLVDAEDDPSAFEYSQDRRDEIKREWSSVIPLGETYIPGIGSVPAVVAEIGAFAEVAKLSGCGKSK